MTHLHQGFWLSVLLVLATTAPAYAYLDPGTGSIILQAILGGVAMGAVTAKLYWHKIKLYFTRRTATPGGRDSNDAR